MIFLRPWGVLMLLMPLLWLWSKRRVSEQSPWKKFMDKELWEALKIKSGHNKSSKRRSRLFLLLWLMWTLALSGPAWDKVPMPARVSQPNTILMMDLNPVMSAETLKKMQMRLYDALDLLKGHRVALVLYGSDEGYTAMPLTPDRALVQQLIPDLTPRVVPQPSTNPVVGLHHAEKLLKQTEQSGQILFFTPDTEQKFSADYPFYLVGPQTNLSALAESIKTSEALAVDSDYQAETWKDMGIWLILFSLPVMLLCFRKNVLFLFLACVVFDAEAGFLTRPDQDSYRMEKQAADAYRQGDYALAYDLFQSAYNKGNALAYQGQIEQAIKAYEQALAENPDDADAKFNKEYLEKQLSQQQNQEPKQDKQQNRDNHQKESQDQQSEGNDSENQGQQNKEDSEQNSSGENQVHDGNDVFSQKQQSDFQNVQPTQDQTVQELEKALSEQPGDEPFNQQEQQILNRLNLDPSRVLRYRLNLQHQRNRK